ncbi:ABC transporter ATP-binding protein [Desulfotomaculum copahuensis]|uniref:ABC-type quaternary amine transporter n=1 Tax=Desulfotomaculum copahuensis TaxID=1838280 RepID=A0A1B7LB27_9FIRM|nr:ABC transporter ATP-binding protein [Desulfotomaculum copahuensis]OAT79529.1 hypothetical protein A6M21_15645 [Desulfotomaculum copahuensis]
MLKLAGVNKKLAGFHLQDINLEVKPKEFFVILGPTGSGKTVLLECLAGMYRLDSGRIFFAGKEITHCPPESRQIGFVYQDYALFPHLNVRQNILFGLKCRKMPADQRKEKLIRICGLLGINPLLDRFPGTLSGGEQQRVALARALVMEPQMLLLDEPMSALDPRTRENFQRVLRRMQKDTGILTIHVTHDFEEAAFLADRIAVMHRGRLEQTGTPEEIFKRPASLFAARFTGAPNVFTGEVLRYNGHQVIRTGHLRLPVQTGLTGPVGFVLHPEYLELLRTPLDKSNCFPGRVIAVYQKRYFYEVTVKVDQLMLYMPVAGNNSHRSSLPGAGDEVWCRILPGGLHFFPLEDASINL